MTKQQQGGGDRSTNIQAGGAVTVVNNGLTPDDAAALALALIRPELERFRGEAVQIVEKRATEFVNEALLPKMLELYPAGIATFADPDIQYAVTAAQRTYGRTGDRDVADVLVDILIDRTKQTQRDVLQIALTESLDVAARLTADQFAVLSLVWLLGYTMNNALGSRDALHSYFDTFYAPLIPVVKTTPATFQHLEYAGCGAVGLGGGRPNMEDAFIRQYPGLFSLGITKEQVAERVGVSADLSGITEHLLTECLNDNSMLQIAALNDEILAAKAEPLNLDPSIIDSLGACLRTNMMTPPAVREYLLSTNPEVAGPLLELWNDSPLRQFNLTSVGIVIAHANVRRITGVSPADISIWIN